jgi:hypothetical protein
MFHKIDYYAFTIPARLAFNEVTDEIQEFVQSTFSSLLPTGDIQTTLETSWSIERAKGFYSHRLRHEQTGIALSFGTINAHVYCELSGKACDCLESANILSPLIASTAPRCSRIDFAVDFVTDIRPEEFSVFRNDTRWKYVSHIVSASGTTDYVGSRTGERMARVYRYNPPHPRAGMLRIEAEYKGDAAKALVRELESRPLNEVCLAAHAPFGWSHAIWNTGEIDAVKIPYSAHSPDNAATVRWLYGVVASSVRKAIQDGLIDWKSFEVLITEGIDDLKL